MRTKLIAGNWKMNLTIPEARALVDGINSHLKPKDGVEVAVCPPFTALCRIADCLKDTTIKLGAQDMFWRDSGAYTGQISPLMLKGVGCDYVIIGHSETRGRFGKSDEELDANISYFSETNKTVNLKVKHALYHDLKPILCVGETIGERESGDTDKVIREQLEQGLAGLISDEAFDLVVAYEPVWAIGTGKVCEMDEAERVCGFIRKTLSDIFDVETANTIRVLYGGSVNASNSAALLKKPNIDGGLVGGASLKPVDFLAIIHSI